MPNPRVLDKRRTSIRNIRKITRTMELIATARFKKALDRAAAASAYTDRITQLVTDLTHAGLEVSHPLLDSRDETNNALLLVLTSNRGLCGGFNGNLQRTGMHHWEELNAAVPQCHIEISGKRGVGAFKFRGIRADESFTHFEDRPTFAEVEVLANRYLDAYTTGAIDRLDIVYMKFHSASQQSVAVETLLPLGSLAADDDAQAAKNLSRNPGEGLSRPSGVEPPKGPGIGSKTSKAAADLPAGSSGQVPYEFLPSPASILEEIVPTGFKVKLFKCFLDSAVSEQIARMIAMKSATENADELIRHLSRQYNRARQSRITSELMDVIGGVEALS